MPAVFLFLLGLFMWFNFCRFGGQEMFLYWPVILIGISVGIMFMPAPYFYQKSRGWLLYSNWRLLLAGIYPVEFRDFFLGDMFCSLTYSMGHIELFFCLYARHWNQPAMCNSSHSRLLGFLSTLPGIWRALQCIRRFYDTRNVFPHLVNCGKYCFTILAGMSLSLWRIDRSTELMAVFIVFATVNSIYCSIWDVIMDWSKSDPTPLPLANTNVIQAWVLLRPSTNISDTSWLTNRFGGTTRRWSLTRSCVSTGSSTSFTEMISRPTPLSPFSLHSRRSFVAVCGLCSESRTNTATTSAGSEHHATSLCRMISRTSQPRNCAASRPAKKTDRKLPMRLCRCHLCRTTHKHQHQTTCPPSVSAPRSRGLQPPISNKATASRARFLSGAGVPVSRTHPSRGLSGKLAIPCALHTHRTTSASVSPSSAVPMQTLQETSTTTMMTMMTTTQAATATTMLVASSPGERGTTSRDRDVIRARKMVGKTWRRRRIWWLELAVEVLELGELSDLIHGSRNKTQNTLDSVKLFVNNSAMQFSYRLRVMFRVANQNIRSD
jgi:hypothetical protein